MEENIEGLKAWGVTIYEEKLEDDFSFADLSRIICELLDEDDDFESLKSKGIIAADIKEKQIVT